MTKELHSVVLFAFILVSSIITAQEEAFKGEDILFSHNDSLVSISALPENESVDLKKVISYKTCDSHDFHNHDVHQELHSHDATSISLIDIISSDAGADFNCSGGFCMDEYTLYS